MEGICVQGLDIAPEFHGDIAEATLVNLKPARGGLVRPDPGSPGEMSWTFRSFGGLRGVYLKYYSEIGSPCEMLVNGQTVLRHAAFEATLGEPDWRYQATTELPAGESRITLRVNSDGLDLRAIALAEPPVYPPVPVDAYFEMLEQERSSADGPPLQVQPSAMAGLVETARRFNRDEATQKQLQGVLNRLVLSVRRDAADSLPRTGWGGPMNGQRYRQQVFQRLMRLGVDVIAETGTFLGVSTAYFARQNVPVFSCEVQKKYFAAAIAHLTDCRNVTLSLEDSRSFLRRLAADPGFAFELPLFYLDAHWNDDLPLADEIGIIRERWRDFVIMVDDFQVPGTDYVYDRYAGGKELSLAFLDREGVDLGDLAVLFPSAGPEAETGAKRGTLVLVPAHIHEARLRQERTLYRHPPGGG